MSHCHFFLSRCGHPRDLASFPTRRSSDLSGGRGRGWRRRRGGRRRRRRRRGGWGDGGWVGCHTRGGRGRRRSEEHTSALQSPCNLVCRLLLEKKKSKSRSFLLFSRKMRCD